jgi:hypothetical protein
MQKRLPVVPSAHPEATVIDKIHPAYQKFFENLIVFIPKRLDVFYYNSIYYLLEI